MAADIFGNESYRGLAGGSIDLDINARQSLDGVLLRLLKVSMYELGKEEGKTRTLV